MGFIFCEEKGRNDLESHEYINCMRFTLSTEEGAQHTAAVEICLCGHRGQPLGRLEVGWDGQTPFKSGRASLRSLRVAGAAERIRLAGADPSGGCSASGQQFFQNKNFSTDNLQ
jgi:hypothetical protein